MKKKRTQSPSLSFTNLYSVRGLYQDGKGNEFHIYVSGEKKEVDKFIRYQKHKLSKGEIGIWATVQKDPSPSSFGISDGKKQRSRGNSPVEFRSGKVKIGISRHKIVTRRPYVITYHIDPKIKTPPQSIALNEKEQPVPDFEFEFDGPTANVTCTVSQGKVDFTLIEVGKGLAAGPTTVEDIPGKNTGDLKAISNGTIQKWRVEAVGKRPGKESEFDLEYKKKFN